MTLLEQINTTKKILIKFLNASTTLVVGNNSQTEQGAAAGNNPLSSFSKASFISAGAESNAHVDVTDPDFWKKLMPDAPQQNPLVQFVPRKRRQVNRSGNVDTVAITAAIDARSDSDSEMEEYEAQEETQEDITVGWNIRDRNK